MKNLPVLILFIVLALNGSVSAQPEIDTSFNSTGMFVMNFASTGTTSDVIVQPNDKILLSATCSSNFFFYSFCIMRTNATGGFDTSWGGTGYVLTNVGSTNAANGQTGLALQNDGKIIAVGTAGMSSSSRYAVVRYNSDGSLDSSFGTNGSVLGTIAGNTQGQKVLIQPDGKILVLAASGSSGTNVQYVARHLSNGTIDDSFGTNGVVQLSQVIVTFGSLISLQPDGKIVVGGTGRVTRLNSNGSFDTTFDGDGTVNVASGVDIVAVDVQSDGKIVALGFGNNTLYRFNSDGSPDTSFNGTGTRQALMGTTDQPYDILVTPSGKINVAGNPGIQDNFPNIFFRYARYIPNGSPDTTFSDDGYLDVNFLSYTAEGATAVTIDRQGRLVAGGRASNGSIVRAPWNLPQFAAARLISGSSQNVGFSGRVAKANGKAVANAYLTLKSGSDIIGYARTNPFGYFHFTNIPSAQTYTLSTNSKNLTFYDRNVLVDGAIENFSVVGF